MIRNKTLKYFGMSGDETFNINSIIEDSSALETIAMSVKDIEVIIEHIESLSTLTSKYSCCNPDGTGPFNEHFYTDFKEQRKEFIDILYNYIEELQKDTKPDSTKTDELTIKQVNIIGKIENAFKFTLTEDPRKHEHILTPEDHEKLIKWVTFFFTHKFKIPEITEPIEIVNTSKGNIFTAFKELFDDLHPEMTRPESFFELIKKCFIQYRNDKKENIEKTKKPEGYDELIIKSK